MRARCCGLVLLCAALVVSGRARAQGEDFVPFEESPATTEQPAPAAQPPPAEPPAVAPSSPPVAPSSPPAARTPAPSTNSKAVPDAAVWAAQYGTACLVPMLAGNLAIIPGLGQVLVFLIPALNGFLVQVVGDALSGRSTSPIAAIVGAYIGQFCVMPVCTTTGVVTFLGLYLGGALGFIYGTTTTRRLDPLTLGFWLGLGAVGAVAMGASIITGLAVSAVVPVAAHALFAVDDKAPASPAPAPEARASATNRRPRSPQRAIAVAY